MKVYVVYASYLNVTYWLWTYGIIIYSTIKKKHLKSTNFHGSITMSTTFG